MTSATCLWRLVSAPLHPDPKDQMTVQYGASPLQRLPTELRQAIYQHVIFPHNHGVIDLAKFDIPSALLGVSRAVRKDALEIIAHKATGYCEVSMYSRLVTLHSTCNPQSLAAVPKYVPAGPVCTALYMDMMRNSIPNIERRSGCDVNYSSLPFQDLYLTEATVVTTLRGMTRSVVLDVRIMDREVKVEVTGCPFEVIARRIELKTTEVLGSILFSHNPKGLSIADIAGLPADLESRIDMKGLFKEMLDIVTSDKEWFESGLDVFYD